MKINNAMLIGVCNAMENCYNRANTISKKWKVTDIAKRYYDVKAAFDAELNRIIKEQGQDGQISTDNEDFQELLKCESEVSPLTMAEIDVLNPSIQDMMILREIVNED